MNIFIFRNDIRTHDNITYLQQKKMCKKINGIYFWKNVNAKQDALKKEALNQLKKYVKLKITLGNRIDVLNKILKKYGINSIGFNIEYNADDINADIKLMKWCKQHNIKYLCNEDKILISIIDNNYLPHHFSNYYQNALQHKIVKPMQLKQQISIDVNETSTKLNLGTVSIRQVAYINRNNREFMRQLYWRNYYYMIGYKTNIEQSYYWRKWKHNKKQFIKWCKGKTEIPIVDAYMRELNKTGYISNRGRLIVASYLTKDLQINWQFGAKWFKKTLRDYDMIQNNGNWQWIASTGYCRQMPFRKLSVYRQAKKYDSNCEHMKKWLPELKNMTNKEIFDKCKL